MSEIFINPLAPKAEQPVLDSTLFLLHRSNRAFVERRINRPYLGSASGLNRETESYIIPFILLAVFSGRLLATLPFPSGLWAVIILLVLFSPFIIHVINRHRDAQSPDVSGWILPGNIINAEKVRVKNWGLVYEQVGVWYEFVTQVGEVIEGYAQGDSKGASNKMAPTPDTPVRVWYDDDGNHYLL